MDTIKIPSIFPPRWVYAETRGLIGQRDLPPNHLAHYSKTQYEADCKLILHFVRHPSEYSTLPFWKQVNRKTVFHTVRGVLLTAPDSKIQSLAKGNQQYRLWVKSFDILTKELGFAAWIK